MGIAGGAEKCSYITELGFDAAIDYKSEDVMSALREQCPKGIDVYFDNVGGDILDAALAHLARNARVVICGAISQYNATDTIKGPSNYLSLLVNHASMTGFVFSDYLDRIPEAAKALGWMGRRRRAVLARGHRRGPRELPRHAAAAVQGREHGQAGAQGGRRLTRRLSACACVAALCLMPALCDAPARAGTAYVDGISDQSLPAWDGGFAESYFGRLFSAVWVSAGHISLARYVAQWNVMSEAGGRADPQGDYREKLEAWLGDVAALGLVPEVSLTSYDGVYPRTVAQYQTALGLLLDRATAMGHPAPLRGGVERAQRSGSRAGPESRAADELGRCPLRTAPTAARWSPAISRIPPTSQPTRGDTSGRLTSRLRSGEFTPTTRSNAKARRRLTTSSRTSRTAAPASGSGSRRSPPASAPTMAGGSWTMARSDRRKRSRWLVDTLMRDRAPEHVFYFSFLPGERRQPSCAERPRRRRAV